ncbi:MAG: ThiF family adenylyltransferase [Chloroflexota bacterium]|nr:ThiF family adenylyltransferase [Chloroflexota bacterium]
MEFDDDYLLGGDVMAYRLAADSPHLGRFAIQRGLEAAVRAMNDILRPSRLAARSPATVVLLPIAWSAPGEGDTGTLRLGASPFGSALAAIGIEGVARHAALSAEGALLQRAFPIPRAGLWVRGQWPDTYVNSAETIVAGVEEQIAEAQRVSIDAVRERLRTEVAGLFARSDGESTGIWEFVRRMSTGEAVVLRTWEQVPTPSIDRAPYAPALRSKHIAIIGCGAVGWAVATLLARSGITHFTLFDDDTIYSTNLPRLGAFFGTVGRFKVLSLRQQLEAIAPGVEVRAVPLLVGRAVGTLGLIDGRPDLIINLTGEEISTEETNRAALILDRPALFAWVSNGVAAGRILRVRPFVSACYECVRDSEPEPINSYGPVPVGDETPWSGSLIDVEAFAAAVTQIAVRTLSGHRVSQGNPDHLVLDFAGPVPSATPVVIARDPSCAECGFVGVRR